MIPQTHTDRTLEQDSYRQKVMESVNNALSHSFVTGRRRKIDDQQFEELHRLLIEIHDLFEEVITFKEFSDSLCSNTNIFEAFLEKQHLN